MKIGIVVVAHNSEEHRPNGNKFIADFISSVNESIKDYDYEIIVVDNESNPPLDLNNAHVLRVNDQTIYGLTGAWELGVNAGIRLGCDIIILNNDDLLYNQTINNFIKDIDEHVRHILKKTLSIENLLLYWYNTIKNLNGVETI